MVGARYAPNVPRAWKSFWAHPMALLGDIGQVEARLDHLEIVLISTQDRCMVCTECITCLEIFLGTLMVLLGDIGQVEAHFGSFGDSTNIK
jgi:hypothetical protein